MSRSVGGLSITIVVIGMFVHACSSETGGKPVDSSGVPDIDTYDGDSSNIVDGGSFADGAVGDADIVNSDAVGTSWGTITHVDGIMVDRFVALGAPIVDVDRSSTNLVCATDGVYSVSDVGAVAGPLVLEAPCARVDFHQHPYVTDSLGRIHRLSLVSSPSVVRSYLGPGTDFQALSATGDDTDIYVAAGEAGLLHVDAATGVVTPLGLAAGANDLVRLSTDGPVVFAVATESGISVVDVTAAIEKTAELWGGTWRVAETSIAGQSAVVAAGPLGGHFVQIALDNTPNIAGSAVGRGVPIDIAGFQGCAVAAEWNNVARYGCNEEIQWLFGEELWSPQTDIPSRLHVSAIASDAFGTVVVGTDRGLAWLSVGDVSTGPDAYFATNRVDFREVTTGASESIGVILANDGDAPLLVKAISVDNPAFSVEIDPDFAGDVDLWAPVPLMVVEANTALGFFEIRFRPTSVSPVYATLRIESNDLDEPIIEIPVVGNSADLRPGNRAPDLWLPSTDNERVALSSLGGAVHYIKFFNGL